MTAFGSDEDPETTLRALGDELALRVQAAIPGYLSRRIAELLEAWGRLELDAATVVRSAIDAHAPSIAIEIADALRALFALPAARQDRTPLQIVAGVGAYPTTVLRDAGIAPVERDETLERMWPDDLYDLVPHAFSDLGDPDLGALQLAWGMAKHRALRTNS